MSSTRHAGDDAPLSQERYLSDPEYAAARGASGVAVAARAALLEHPAKRSLLWFLQALSLEAGGFKKVAADLVALFPERIGTATMHRLGMKPGRVYSGGDVARIKGELGSQAGRNDSLRADDWTHEAVESVRIPGSRQRSRFAELARCGRESDGGIFSADTSDWIGDEPVKLEPCSSEKLIDRCRLVALNKLPSFLLDLCINPRLMFPEPGKTAITTSEAERALEEFPEMLNSDIGRAGVAYFRDAIGALYEFQRRHQEQVRAGFVLTEIGRKVWETLDFALEARRMVLIDGLEGRGKTEAARAWCRLHMGEVRFVSLKGITGKTNLFRAISQALGVGCGRGYSALEMQNRIEDVLQRSGLALVFDEAHYLFDPKPRMYARPELVDWVDTALCNHGVPVGLVSTPQLLQSVRQAGEQTGWNHRQFRRRVKRYVQLPAWNTDADLLAVAAKLLPGIGRGGIKLAVGYAKLSKRDVSGLGDVAEEARLLAQGGGRQAITFEDVERAIKEQLLPSDASFEKALNASSKGGRQSLRSHVSAPLQAPCSAAAEPANFDADSAEEALAPDDFPQRDTRPVNLGERNSGARVTPGSHRQTHPALVPV